MYKYLHQYFPSQVTRFRTYWFFHSLLGLPSEIHIFSGSVRCYVAYLIGICVYLLQVKLCCYRDGHTTCITHRHTNYLFLAFHLIFTISKTVSNKSCRYYRHLYFVIRASYVCVEPFLIKFMKLSHKAHKLYLKHGTNCTATCTKSDSTNNCYCKLQNSHFIEIR